MRGFVRDEGVGVDTVRRKGSEFGFEEEDADVLAWGFV